ncbi:MAG: bifunctional isocitrate dehydrogenase kinase/phosphatase [Chitinophagales bacterium]|nr:bifunctional isocitrate dehydrogenase kinase/phosphatase [Chitinophagales bacterium]
MKDLVENISSEILKGYVIYIEEFNRITRKAKDRFKSLDWKGMQSDSQARLLLYKSSAKSIAHNLRTEILSDKLDLDLWQRVKADYSSKISSRHDFEIAETFYNSVVRKLFVDVVIDSGSMFVLLERTLQEMKTGQSLYKVYPGNLTSEEIVRNVLKDYLSEFSFEDKERDIRNVVDAIQSSILSKYKPDRETRVEIIKPIFYRNKAAYIVGRTIIEGRTIPFVLPILNSPDGIFIDTVIFDPNTVSVIFSFTRSYFMVEAAIPFEMVNFLKTLMPNKRYSELYNSIGFNKHGKTVFYRSLLNHLEKSSDKFIIAPGIKGMVMTVFTLPSYPVVFKLIKDKFDPPKSLSRGQVKTKYKLVSIHDRVGRMADTHEFEHFILPKDRFSEELLEELSLTVPSLIKEEGNSILIKHLYTERRMIPLNMYLENAAEKEAEVIIRDYGNAIKQLAAANIFPGDMLLKNFGVTRHGRVVFYDYDEICHITDCRFRYKPQPRNDYEEFSSDAYFSVQENDIFPEEFRKFLIGRNEIRELFFKLHDDLFEASYWNTIKRKLENGEFVDVYPYPDEKRFKVIKKGF